ncbi:MAG: efflux RND transporter periplasmic adaptor subunit [Acidobacteriota bacterium]
MAKRAGWKRIRLVVLIVIGLGLVATAFFGIAAALRPKKDIDPAKLATIERGPLARSVVATGKIEPLNKVDVKSKASGIVKKLFVDYGDQVKQGQILADLDKEELTARQREAQAALQAAQASLQASQAAFERNKVEAEGPDLPFLKSSMERAQALFNEKLISKSVVEESEKNYQMALNKQMTVLRNISVSRAEITRAEAQVAQAQAALDRTNEDLRNSTIVSPIDGIVLSRDVEVGDAVSSILVLGSQATLVMTLGDTGNMYVLGKVDEADIGKIYINQPARIVLESYKDKKFQGTITKISPLGVEKDNVTSFEVRVSIQNSTGELRANMSANAEIILEEKQDVLLIPETAIIYDKERNASVEIPDINTPTGKNKIPVKVGISNGVKTELIEGLKEGQKVILQ